MFKAAGWNFACALILAATLYNHGMTTTAWCGEFLDLAAGYRVCLFWKSKSTTFVTRLTQLYIVCFFKHLFAGSVAMRQYM